MAIERVEFFVVSQSIDPPRGPSIAYASSYAYVYVKLTDADGATGWGETYRVPGAPAIIGEVAPLLIGREPDRARSIWTDVWRAAEHPYSASAISIAVDDLRARRLGLPVHALYGGAVRTSVRAYAASGGYIEGVGPEDVWPAEVEAAAAAGFTAFKLRIGRYPMRRELPLIERLRAQFPAPFVFVADGNGGFEPARALEVGRELQRLGFLWWEEPLPQWEGYAAFERLAARLDIALAGGEILMSRHAAAEFLARAAVDLVQPEPVICGGVGEALFIAELARLHAIAALPHTSGSGVGIAAALQLAALLPSTSNLPGAGEPLLEIAVDHNVWRTATLREPIAPDAAGRVAVPIAPGLGVEVDEAYLRGHALETGDVR